MTAFKSSVMECISLLSTNCDTAVPWIEVLQVDQTMLLFSSRILQQEPYDCVTCKVLPSLLQCHTNHLHGCSGQVLQMDASDKEACVTCLESAVVTLSAALHVLQASFDSLQASCFADVTVLSTPGWAEQVLNEWSDTCGIQHLVSIARQICEKVGCRTLALAQIRHVELYLTVGLVYRSTGCISVKAISAGRA